MKTEKLTKEDVKKLLGAKGRKKFEWSKGDIRKKEMSYTYKDNTDEVLFAMEEAKKSYEEFYEMVGY